MKKYIYLVLIAFSSLNVMAQNFCSQPNPNFCPGNYFTNGDFENITGNPTTNFETDINLATGWLPVGNGLADLACGGTVQSPTSTWFNTPPFPNTGVYAGMWIQNTISRTTNAIHREGMYNRLNTPILQSTGNYTFTFDISKGMANTTAPTDPGRIGIYGVFNPGNIASNVVTGLYTPLNVNLWNTPVKVVQLGSVTVPNSLNNNWQSQTVTFNSNILPTGGITHILITSDDMVVNVNSRIYVNFDNFCLQVSKPPVLPPDFDCCKTPLDIWNYYGTPDPLPIQSTFVNNTKLSYAEETFELHRDATIPITELKVNITDIQFEYNYEQCAECINNPALWGSIISADNTIGTLPNALTQSPYWNLPALANLTDNGINQREIIWNNPNGAMLKTGDTFKVSYLLPPASDIPCCATKVKICTKISWKDANCNVCEVYTCSNIALDNSIKSLGIESKSNGCCERTLTANSDVPSTYLWSTGETSQQIDVSQNGSYSVTATAGGNSITQSIIVNNIPSGNFPILDHSSRFDPTGNATGIHDKFYIFDSQKSLNAGNAYNATKYKLWIFNRWGELIREYEDENCNGFKNWSIQWDGKDNQGNYVQDGTYEWRFFVQNCKYKNDIQVSFRTGFEKCGCKRRFLGICLNWNYCPKVEKVIVGHVNVLR